MMPDADLSLAELRDRLEAYYTRYYRDVLGLPGWRQRVEWRLASDDEFDGKQVTSVQDEIGPLNGRRMLNVGCGTGGFNVAADRAGALPCGVDVNVEAVTICWLRRTLDHRGLYAAAAAEALPFRDDEFDLVVCLSALEHVADVPASLREMARVLRPEGTLLLYAPHGWALYESHYKLTCFPLFLRQLARLRLKWARRPTAFLDTLNALTERRCRRLLEAAAMAVERPRRRLEQSLAGGLGGRLVRVYYRALRINTNITLVARKRKP